VNLAKVLIVDDNLDLAQALELRLRANDYHALLAHDRASAIALALDQEPVAILLDLHLANEDGFAVMQEFQSSSELASVPIIVVSADCSSLTQHKVLDAGAHGFLEKPVNHRLLLHMLRDIQMRSPKSGLPEGKGASKAAAKD
jgi:DNA-binding response OmpR family regulator